MNSGHPFPPPCRPHSKAVGHAKTGGFALDPRSSILGIERGPSNQPGEETLALVRPTKHTFRVVPLKRRLWGEEQVALNQIRLRVAANIAKLPELFQP